MKNYLLPEKSIPFLMSQNDLKKLGLEEVAYVKKYRVRGQTAFVLHAADGTALAVQDNAGAVQASAQHQDLEVVPLH